MDSKLYTVARDGRKFLRPQRGLKHNMEFIFMRYR